MKIDEPMVTIKLSNYNSLNDIVNNKHVVHRSYNYGFGWSETTTVYTKDGLLDNYIAKIEILERKLEKEKDKSLLKRIFG